jgi:hypothetical protein
MNGVIETATGDLLRAGYTDFSADGSFDSGTESYRTDVPLNAATKNSPNDDGTWSRWDGSDWISASPSLDDKKAAKMAAIDLKTMQLIAGGFTHASKQFSLSVYAQIKVMGLRVGILSGDIVDPTDYPIDVSAMDETDYEIPDETDAKAYFKAGLDRVKDTVTVGSELKQDCLDAADQAALDLVVDNRT